METTCSGAPNVYSLQCPCRPILDRLAHKWTALIIGRLQDQPYRFNQLLREIPGLSAKVLTQTLRSLERDGIITRTVYPTTPVSVEYALTDLGVSVAKPLGAVRKWAEDHRDDVVQANLAYDSLSSDTIATVAQLNQSAF